LIQIRRSMPHTKRKSYPHGHDHNGDGWRDIEWLHHDGGRMQEEDWRDGRAMTVLFPEADGSRPDGEDSPPQHDLIAVAIMLNADAAPRDFVLPEISPMGRWNIEFHSTALEPPQTGPASWRLTSRSVICAVCRVEEASVLVE
jgi:pullulanase/glycogen debranching enzyme